ncbi:DUF1173 family protein [Gluconacetobacter diazotrophicus]|uniref:DUF1173 family protein n=1 Tax=Gluconacetobacter diazotrophicus TaxID=33996 RepID=A0A7W4I8E3_GLUDI|nr:DUF1173 family protein [Gluconacetobacter diazotrophicus]MBB2158119.1 DUF1173 family protein [Gluconacetobacter diazotrophicus]
MSARDWITFPATGRRARYGWARDLARAGAWQALLASAHGDPRQRPHCDCRWQGRPLELVVRERRHEDDGQVVTQFHLARMPGQGRHHGPACPFHETDPQRSGRSDYVDGVVRQLDDGRVSVLLDRGLRVAERASAPVRPQLSRGDDASRPARHRQARMRQLGLLHLLWESAGLTNWEPAVSRRRAFWPGVRAALADAAHNIVAGRTALDRHLVPIGYRDPEGVAQLAATVDRCGDSWRVLMVGVVDQLRVDGGGVWRDGTPRPPRLRLTFDGARDYALFVAGDAALASRLQLSYPWACRELARERSARSIKVVGLVSAQVRRTGDAGNWTYNAWTDSVSLMEVGPSLIPVASSYELAILTALQDAGRVFRKPLRFDAAQDVVLPDFELLDTAAPQGTPLEVFGRQDEAYQARREVKRAYYSDVYGADGWWSWDATRGAPWPAFPPPQGGASGHG